MNWRYAKSLQDEVLPTEMFEDSDLWDEKTEREMHARIFVLPQLLPLLQEAKARWRYINHGYQFRFRGGYVLCWWARTGSMIWQGHEKGEEEFLPNTKDVVVRVKEFVAIPYLGDLYPEEFPEPVKFRRRKPGKGEMQRQLEARKDSDDDRGRKTGENDQGGGGVVSNRSVEVLQES